MATGEAPGGTYISPEGLGQCLFPCVFQWHRPAVFLQQHLLLCKERAAPSIPQGKS